MKISDEAAIGGLVSSPLWWQLLNEWGHAILLALGIAIGSIKLYLYIRQLREPTRKVEDEFDEGP